MTEHSTTEASVAPTHTTQSGNRFAPLLTVCYCFGLVRTCCGEVGTLPS